jgi:hypothetical protein
MQGSDESRAASTHIGWRGPGDVVGVSVKAPGASDAGEFEAFAVVWLTEVDVRGFDMNRPGVATLCGWNCGFGSLSMSAVDDGSPVASLARPRDLTDKHYRALMFLRGNVVAGHSCAHRQFRIIFSPLPEVASMTREPAATDLIGQPSASPW